MLQRRISHGPSTVAIQSIPFAVAGVLLAVLALILLGTGAPIALTVAIACVAVLTRPAARLLRR